MIAKIAAATISALTAATVGLTPIPTAPNTTIAAPSQATQTIEACQWVDIAGQWEYPDQTPCRGTGEDPTTDAAGNPACANHHPAIAEHRYGTTIYTCTGTPNTNPAPM